MRDWMYLAIGVGALLLASWIVLVMWIM